MSIDGIGNGNRGLGGAPGVGIAEPTAGLDAAESTSAAVSTVTTAAASDVQGSQALEALRSGALSFDGYIDQQVTRATAHLEHLVTPEQFQVLTERLRLELLSEPGLVQLLKRTTGQPPPQEA